MFKKDDLIECIEGYPGLLTRQKIYKVISQTDRLFVEVKADKNVSGGWRADRFRLVPKEYSDGLDNWE